MSNASATDRIVWQEFLQTPETIIDASLPVHLNTSGFGFADNATAWKSRTGNDVSAPTTARRGQQFFRDMILTGYQNRCALTEVNDPRLLNASHIVGWADAPKLRLNPTNGLCLNTLHDRAFDRHLITFDEDYQMQVASDVPWDARKSLEKVDSRRLTMPTRFLPNQTFLEQHRRRFYNRLLE
ncbi:HNH endonuclease [Parasedimentitalea huanghaiensis]|nr:HNH endonuclease [Zongyanglinia huanghaiensis]